MITDKINYHPRNIDVYPWSYITKFTTNKITESTNKLITKLSSYSDTDASYFNKISTISAKLNSNKFSSINKGVNKYILKPHCQARGIGIKTLKNINNIMMELALKKNSNFIIQKYIENPLLFNERKFDIRIWTVITSTSPCISWVWQKF